MRALRDVEFALPGTWWSLDLRGDRSAIDRRIRDLVDREIGPRDDLAKVRHDLRDRLARVADESRTTKTDQIHIARTLIGPMPFPVSLAVSQPGIAVPLAASAAETAEVIAGLIPGSNPAVVEHPRLAVARSTDSRPALSAAEPGGPLHPRLTANYWVELGGTGKLAIFTFTASLAGLDEELLTLFDAIAYSIRLREPATPDEAAPGASGMIGSLA